MTGCMTAMDVQLAVIGRFNLRTTLAVPNVSWGLIPWGECDLLLMTGSGYLTEIEIKISVSDMRREWQKKRWRNPVYRRWFQERIKNYYVAAPANVAGAGEGIVPPDIGAGLMAVDDAGSTQILVPAKTNSAAKALTQREQYQLARLGVFRYWKAARALQQQMVKP